MCWFGVLGVKLPTATTRRDNLIHNWLIFLFEIKKAMILILFLHHILIGIYPMLNGMNWSHTLPACSIQKNWLVFHSLPELWSVFLINVSCSVCFRNSWCPYWLDVCGDGLRMRWVQGRVSVWSPQHLVHTGLHLGWDPMSWPTSPLLIRPWLFVIVVCRYCGLCVDEWVDTRCHLKSIMSIKSIKINCDFLCSFTPATWYKSDIM